MASHWSFGHLQPKLWAKEGSGVKLAIWLQTTKSQESTSSRHVLRECDMALESSLQGLQVWFRPCPDRRSRWGAMKSQSPRSLNWDNFRTPLRESREKEPFGCHSRGRTQSILWGVWWWHLPSPGRDVSCESELARGLSQHQMHAEWVLTNLCWFWMQVRDQIAWSLPSLIPELPTRPFYPS
jgi:hypothetical protein